MKTPPVPGEPDRRGLTDLASRKIDAIPRNLTPERTTAATALLADLYATGLQHGVDPDVWAAVADLGVEVLDALALRDQLPPRRPPSPDPARRDRASGRAADREPRSDRGRQR